MGHYSVVSLTFSSILHCIYVTGVYVPLDTKSEWVSVQPIYSLMLISVYWMILFLCSLSVIFLFACGSAALIPCWLDCKLKSFFLFFVSVFVGACLITFLMTALYEGLKMFRQWLVCRPLRLLIKDLWKSRSASEDITDNEDASSNKETLQQHAARFPRDRWIWFTELLLYFSFVQSKARPSSWCFLKTGKRKKLITCRKVQIRRRSRGTNLLDLLMPVW